MQVLLRTKLQFEVVETDDKIFFKSKEILNLFEM